MAFYGYSLWSSTNHTRELFSEFGKEFCNTIGTHWLVFWLQQINGQTERTHSGLSVMYLFLDKYSHGLIQDSYCCYHSRLCHWQQQTQWKLMTVYFRILMSVTVTSLRVTPKTPKSFSTVMTNHSQALVVIRSTIMPLHCSVSVNHGWTNEAFFLFFSASWISFNSGQTDDLWLIFLSGSWRPMFSCL